MHAAGVGASQCDITFTCLNDHSLDYHCNPHSVTIAVHTIYLTGLLPRVTYQENCATGATENTCN